MGGKPTFAAGPFFAFANRQSGLSDLCERQAYNELGVQTGCDYQSLAVASYELVLLRFVLHPI